MLLVSGFLWLPRRPVPLASVLRLGLVCLNMSLRWVLRRRRSWTRTLQIRKRRRANMSFKPVAVGLGTTVSTTISPFPRCRLPSTMLSYAPHHRTSVFPYRSSWHAILLAASNPIDWNSSPFCSSPQLVIGLFSALELVIHQSGRTCMQSCYPQVATEMPTRIASRIRTP